MLTIIGAIMLAILGVIAFLYLVKKFAEATFD